VYSCLTVGPLSCVSEPPPAYVDIRDSQTRQEFQGSGQPCRVMARTGAIKKRGRVALSYRPFSISSGCQGGRSQIYSGLLARLLLVVVKEKLIGGFSDLDWIDFRKGT
jgi:hypothetical protein